MDSSKNRNSGRNTDGTFAPGNPGKPRGSRHRATKAISDMLDGEAEALTRVAIDRALAGDGAALRLCLDRIAPPKKDGPVEFDLPEIKNASDAAAAAIFIVKAVAAGDLSPNEGEQIMGLIEMTRRSIETAELEKRLERLEGLMK